MFRGWPATMHPTRLLIPQAAELNVLSPSTVFLKLLVDGPMDQIGGLGLPGEGGLCDWNDRFTPGAEPFRSLTFSLPTRLYLHCGHFGSDSEPFFF